MPRKGKRVRISRGIYKDSSGYECRVVVGGHTYSQRMPKDSTLDELKATRADLESTGREQSPRATKDTLRADMPRYLRQIAHLATVDDREDHLIAWCELYGEVYRHRITAKDVLTARVRWLSKGRPDGVRRSRKRHTGPLSAKTINHYCDTLRNLYHVLDGRKAKTPSSP